MRRVALCALTIALTVLAAVTPAAASPSITSDKPAGRYCARNLATNQVDCFRSFRQAITKATSGAVTDAPEVFSPAIFKDQALMRRLSPATSGKASPAGAVTARASYLLGMLYEHLNYGGHAIVDYQSFTCDTDSGYEAVSPTMPTSWWNDRVSSVKVFNNCGIRLWWDHHYGQPTSAFGLSTGYVGSGMNDETSSYAYY